jgi:hypothetical protein
MSSLAVSARTCSICDEERVEFVACQRCHDESCRECFCTTLLYADLEPKCMHDKCRVPLPYETLILSTPPEWFNGPYREHRSTLLAKREAAQLQETQAAVTAYHTALIIRGRNHFLNLPVRLQDNVKRCIRERGRGFEGFDFDSEDNSKPKGLQLPCPAPGCHGLINDNVCAACATEICPECHEILKDGHRCNMGTVLTIRAIFKDARPCPKCAARISKISGCDQMFCTQCHTTYDWETGDILAGQVHNPHYFAWLATQQPVVERLVANGEYQCDQYLSYQNLNRCFRQSTIGESYLLRGRLPSVNDLLAPLPSHAHYYLAFLRLRDNILDVRANSGNHANVQPVNNLDLRVRLVTNEITREQLRTEVYKRDHEYRRVMAYHHVYMLVYETAIVIFDNVYAFTCERYKLAREWKRNYPRERFFYESYAQLQKLLAFANECLEFNDKVYGKNERFGRYKRHPYS